MDGAAHVEAARQRNAHLRRERHRTEVLEQVVHHRLDYAGGVGGRGVTVYPALCVDNARNRIARASDRQAENIELSLEAVDFAFVRKQELHVVSARKAQMAVAELFREVGHVPYIVGADEAASAHADRVQLISAFAHVH